MTKKILCVVLLAFSLVCILVSCGDNNNKTNSNESSDHIHSYSEWETVKEATFTEKGSESRKCDCGKTETRDIAKRESFMDRLNNRNYRVEECDECLAQDFELCYNLDINDYNIVESFDVWVDDDFGAWMLTIVKCDSVSIANRLASDLKPFFTSAEEKVIVIDTYVFLGNANAISDAVGE